MNPIIYSGIEAFVSAWFNFSLFYFLCVNLVSLVLLASAYVSIRRTARERPAIGSTRRPMADIAPPISVLAPAYNEELSIVQSVKSFLMLGYPRHEVIIINDGSKDATLARLVEAFSLRPIEMTVERILSRTRIRAIYACETHPNLLVIDKENGGKADALNVGIEHASTDLFCAVDADSILENDALLKVAMPFLHDPETTIAAGGTVRVVNGSTVRYGRVEKSALPTNPLALLQIVEYLRAFLFGRVGWNAFNATLIISGAFGIFRRSVIVEAGGYQEGSLGEDMELVVRLHKRIGRARKARSIVFIPDPVCWTEVPSDLASLGKQRDRWQRGLAQVLLRNRDILFSPRFGAMGLITFPYYYLVELWGPILEIFSYILVGAGFAFGLLDGHALALFFIVGILFGITTSVVAILIDEASYPRTRRVRDLLILVAMALFENFGYRQLNSYWRLRGLISYFRGKTGWGTLTRKGFSSP